LKIIEAAIYHLLKNAPYYAHFFNGCNIVYDKYGVQRHASAVTSNGILFIFNSKYIESLTVPQAVAAIESEIVHIISRHHKAFRSGQYDPKLLSMSTDIAVDQIISQPANRDLMSGFAVYSELKQLKPKKNWEYYYNVLKEDFKSNGGGGLSPGEDYGTGHQGGTGGGDPDHFLNVPDSLDGEIADQMVGDAAQKAAKKAGFMPAELVEFLGALSGASVMNWRALLRNWLGRNATFQRKPTRKKAHRRYGLTMPGYKKNKLLKIAFIQDTSGSMSNEDCLRALNEAQAIAQSVGEVILISADSKVQNIQKVGYKKTFVAHRHGCGGTMYQPGIEAAVAEKVNGIIYAGDMDIFDEKLTDPKIPVLWLSVDKNAKRPGDFGEIIYLDFKTHENKT
jgi:predicted metal-dependent peptidase